jgi:hypothetical protein
MQTSLARDLMSDEEWAFHGHFIVAVLARTGANRLCWALLHKSAYGRIFPSPGQTHPTASVTGMPSAVKLFRTATRSWNSAT